MQKNDAMHQLCLSNQKYFELFERGEWPGQKHYRDGRIIGLGDAVAWLIKAATFGFILPCNKCRSRAAWLNRLFSVRVGAKRRPRPRIAIVTTSKGRLSHLRETLPGMLGQTAKRFKFAGVVVVDYDCPDGSADWSLSIRDFPAVPLVVVRVENQPIWQASHCRNIGFNIAINKLIADYVMHIDVDMKSKTSIAIERFFARSQGIAGCVVEPDPAQEVGGQCGTALVDARAFRSVGGFDESHSGWGYEDINLYERIGRAGWRIVEAPRLFDHIEHGREGSNRFLKVTLKDATRKLNEAWGHDLTRAVNPDGMGEYTGRVQWRRRRLFGI
jgi:hypothetical protein